MRPIIEVNHLSKKYRYGGSQPYYTLRDILVDIIKKPFNYIHNKQKVLDLKKDEFWALDDVSFKINQGEAVGIIGPNGAGKSTILKVLSRITPPTFGEAILRGRVGSLLEVGTGFQQELTGRENIYLNGAILGMKKKEIEGKFDEIVNFSGVDKFLDTPVKHYSSGMYMRLAFAVAAHLEPEILIVDEVLAVGDAEFQKKCLGKMETVTKGGRSVIFVSHNMGAIAQLCENTIVMKDGKIMFFGKTNKAISLYLDKYNTHAPVINSDRSNLKNKNQFVAISNLNTSNKIQNEYKYDEEVRIVFEIYLPKWDEKLEVGLSPCDKFDRRIFTIDIPLKKYYKGNPFLKLVVTIPGKFITPGNYSWMLFIHQPLVSMHDFQNNVCKFNIIESGSVFSRYVGYDYGCVFPPKYFVEQVTLA